MSKGGLVGDMPERVAVRFSSGRFDCAARHYPGSNHACVVMAAGACVPKEQGTDAFAAGFHRAGFSVLAFDYRRVGESGGEPRQLVRIREQLADWRAAIDFARSLPGVDVDSVGIWGYSLSGGHVLATAARVPGIAAAIAHAPLADGPAATRAALRHQTLRAALRLTGRGIRDGIGGLWGHEPLLVPLAGPPGTVALLTTPDAQDANRALAPPGWPQEIAARSGLRLGYYRPLRLARRIACPLLVVVHLNDQSALPAPGMRAAQRAPRGELVELPGGHYAGYLDAHERALNEQIGFLRRHLINEPPAVETSGPNEATTAADGATAAADGTRA